MTSAKRRLAASASSLELARNSSETVLPALSSRRAAVSSSSILPAEKLPAVQKSAAVVSPGAVYSPTYHALLPAALRTVAPREALPSDSAASRATAVGDGATAVNGAHSDSARFASARGPAAAASRKARALGVSDSAPALAAVSSSGRSSAQKVNANPSFRGLLAGPTVPLETGRAGSVGQQSNPALPPAPASAMTAATQGSVSQSEARPASPSPLEFDRRVSKTAVETRPGTPGLRQVRFSLEGRKDGDALTEAIAVAAVPLQRVASFSSVSSSDTAFMTPRIALPAAMGPAEGMQERSLADVTLPLEDSLPDPSQAAAVAKQNRDLLRLVTLAQTELASLRLRSQQLEEQVAWREEVLTYVKGVYHRDVFAIREHLARISAKLQAQVAAAASGALSLEPPSPAAGSVAPSPGWQRRGSGASQFGQGGGAATGPSARWPPSPAAFATPPPTPVVGGTGLHLQRPSFTAAPDAPSPVGGGPVSPARSPASPAAGGGGFLGSVVGSSQGLRHGAPAQLPDVLSGFLPSEAACLRVWAPSELTPFDSSASLRELVRLFCLRSIITAVETAELDRLRRVEGEHKALQQRYDTLAVQSRGLVERHAALTESSTALARRLDASDARRRAALSERDRMGERVGEAQSWRVLALSRIEDLGMQLAAAKAHAAALEAQLQLREQRAGGSPPAPGGAGGDPAAPQAAALLSRQPVAPLAAARHATDTHPPARHGPGSPFARGLAGRPGTAGSASSAASHASGASVGSSASRSRAAPVPRRASFAQGGGAADDRLRAAVHARDAGLFTSAAEDLPLHARGSSAGRRVSIAEAEGAALLSRSRPISGGSSYRDSTARLPASASAGRRSSAGNVLARLDTAAFGEPEGSGVNAAGVSLALSSGASREVTGEAPILAPGRGRSGKLAPPPPERLVSPRRDMSALSAAGARDGSHLSRGRGGDAGSPLRGSQRSGSSLPPPPPASPPPSPASSASWRAAEASAGSRLPAEPSAAAASQQTRRGSASSVVGLEPGGRRGSFQAADTAAATVGLQARRSSGALGTPLPARASVHELVLPLASGAATAAGGAGDRRASVSGGSASGQGRRGSGVALAAAGTVGLAMGPGPPASLGATHR